ncbi:MAG: adenosylcobinamide-GDP ribazoletransferase [bacterium]
MKSLWLAITFLVRIPLPQPDIRDREKFSQSVVWFPVVGFVVGILIVITYTRILRPLWSDHLSRVLSLIMLVWIKDAFHLDGLSDFVDGLHGGSHPDERHNIMKDSCVGVMGLLSILTAIGIQVFCMLELPLRWFIIGMIMLPMLGTVQAVILLGANTKEDGGLGAKFSSGSTSMYSITPWLISFLLILAVDPTVTMLLWILFPVLTMIFMYVIEQDLNQITGDVCGAWIVIVQTLGWLLYVPLSKIPYWTSFESGLVKGSLFWMLRKWVQ